MRLLMVSLSLLTAAVPALSCPPARFVVAQHQVVQAVQHVVAQPVVAEVLVPTVPAAYVQPVLYPVPAYSASYTPNVQREVAGVDLSQVVAELAAIRAEMVAIRKGAAEPAERPASGLDVVAGRCSKCHAADAAEAKGGGFVLVDGTGKLSPLSLKEQARVTRRIANGTMPPPPEKSLSETEKKSLMLTLKGELQ